MKKLSLIILALILAIPFTYAQKSHLFVGKVFDNGNRLEGAEVSVYRGSKKVSKYVTKKNGKFLFFAIPEVEYVIEVAKEGYLAKRIIVDTDNTYGIDKKPKTFKFDLELDRDSKKNRAKSNDFPVAYIKYNAENNAYQHSLKYAQSLELGHEETIRKVLASLEK